jgi:uncharacterized membrane protein YeiH
MAGTAVFATSGALAAARAGQTPLTFAFFAVVTWIGGNTSSEMLMGAPVVWVHHPTSIVVCLVALYGKGSRASSLDHATRLVAQSCDRFV